MAEHTPGPWHVIGTGICEGEFGHGEIVAKVRPDCRIGDWYANARLIAAAPELLAACRKLNEVDCCTGYSLADADYPVFWEALELARAALARDESREG